MTNHSDLAATETSLPPEHPGNCRATFPIDGGQHGVDQLARRLNAMVEKDSIAAWHLAGWTDWKHTAMRVDFTSPGDVHRAAEAFGDGGSGPGDSPAPPAPRIRAV